MSAPILCEGVGTAISMEAVKSPTKRSTRSSASSTIDIPSSSASGKPSASSASGKPSSSSASGKPASTLKLETSQPLATTTGTDERRVAQAAVEQEVDECVICMEVKSKAPFLAVLSCNHSFCEPCLKSWGKQETTCPLCKSEFLQYKKLRQSFNPLTATGNKRKRGPPKEVTVKVQKKTQQAPMPRGIPEMMIQNMMMAHLDNVHPEMLMAMLGGRAPQHAEFMLAHRLNGRGEYASEHPIRFRFPPGERLSSIAARLPPVGRSTEGRSAGNAIVLDEPERRSNAGVRFSSTVPVSSSGGANSVIDLTGDDDLPTYNPDTRRASRSSAAPFPPPPAASSSRMFEMYHSDEDDAFTAMSDESQRARAVSLIASIVGSFGEDDDDDDDDDEDYDDDDDDDDEENYLPLLFQR